MKIIFEKKNYLFSFLDDGMSLRLKILKIKLNWLNERDEMRMVGSKFRMVQFYVFIPRTCTTTLCAMYMHSFNKNGKWCNFMLLPNYWRNEMERRKKKDWGMRYVNICRLHTVINVNLNEPKYLRFFVPINITLFLISTCLNRIKNQTHYAFRFALIKIFHLVTKATRAVLLSLLKPKNYYPQRFVSIIIFLNRHWSHCISRYTMQFIYLQMQLICIQSHTR